MNYWNLHMINLNLWKP